MAVLNHLYLSEVKQMLGTSPGYSGDDFRLKLAIASATQTIENLLGRTYTYNTYTEVHGTRTNYQVGWDIYGVNHSGKFVQPIARQIYLCNYPIDTTAPFTVYYDFSGAFIPPNSDATNDGEENCLQLDTTQYVLDPIAGTLIPLIDTITSPNSLQVTYSAGFQGVADPNYPSDITVQNSLPPDMVMAAMFQTLHVYSKMDTSNINATSQLSTGKSSKGAYVNKAAVAPETMAIIMQNRRPRFAAI